jgi:prepilin-type N-terminal cleavage/methylation domain-containing protein
MALMKATTSILKRAGFTLSELLVALLVLGVIATFTIGKITQSSTNASKMTVIKEAISSLNAITYQGMLLNPSLENVHYTYLSNHLNFIKTCPSNSNTQGCWPSPATCPHNGPGFVLPNSAMINGTGNDVTADGDDSFCLDWNGSEGPNTMGDDQLELRTYFQTSGLNKAGTVRPVPGHTVSINLYNAAFQR